MAWRGPAHLHRLFWPACISFLLSINLLVNSTPTLLQLGRPLTFMKLYLKNIDHSLRNFFNLFFAFLFSSIVLIGCLLLYLNFINYYVDNILNDKSLNNN